MNISWRWLGELIDLQNIEPRYLADKLTLAGFEVENIIHDSRQDIKLEISSTTNRSDTLSMIGIAKEISMLLQRPLRESYTQTNLKIKYKSKASRWNNTQDYLACQMNNIKIAESPQWLKDRLAFHGITSKNNLLDIINFTYLKWSLTLQVIKLDRATRPTVKYDELTRLDNFNNEDTNAKIQDINHIIDKNTEQIIIHSSILRARTVSEHRKKLPLSSQDSLVHIQNIDAKDVVSGYSEAIALISHVCKATVYSAEYFLNARHIYKTIPVNYNNVRKILGPIKDTKSNNLNYLKDAEIEEILDSLSCIMHRERNYKALEIPNARINDLYREIDIIEEISRVYGFNHFIDVIPRNTRSGRKGIRKYRVEQIRSSLRNLGLHEAIHYSMTNNKDTSIHIHNPLKNEYRGLRSSLLANIIEANTYNLEQGNGNINIFEIGKIFKLSTESSNAETNHIAGIIGGKKYIRSEWSERPQNISWFQAKGDMEDFFERLNMHVDWGNTGEHKDINGHNTARPYMHPKYSAIIYINKKPIGVFGQLYYKNKKHKNSGCNYGFEFSLQEVLMPNIEPYIFHEYSMYPCITRDVSVNIPTEILFKDLEECLKKIKDPIIESIDLFDVYTSNKKSDNKQRICLRITYRDLKNTLTGEQVENVEHEVKKIINNSIGRPISQS